jgi:hypothetical protein
VISIHSSAPLFGASAPTEGVLFVVGLYPAYAGSHRDGDVIVGASVPPAPAGAVRSLDRAPAPAGYIRRSPRTFRARSLFEHEPKPSARAYPNPKRRTDRPPRARGLPPVTGSSGPVRCLPAARVR